MQKLLKKFYKNKRVLITGNTGFKGTWLTLILENFGAKIMGYSISELDRPNMFNLLNIKDRIKFIQGDIRDSNKLKTELNKFKPEIIIHLAAQSLVKESFKSPLYTVSTNVMGSANILEYSRNSSFLKSLIYVTTDKCYVNNEWVWGYRENDKIGGIDPYSASKAAAENLFSGYLHSYFKAKKIGAASVRAGNVIGGGDWANDRIIPDLIRSIKNNKRLIIRNPLSIRPWQHVLEPLIGYLILGMKLYNNHNYSGAWNFGPSSTEVLSVKKVVSIFAQKLDIKKKNIIFNKPNKNDFKESKLLKINCDKAHDLLKWNSKLSAVESIDLTCDWYQNYLEKNKLNEFTISQIRSYLNKSR